MRRTLVLGALFLAAAGYVRARPNMLRWGATDAEVAALLPGDELLDEPTLVTTRAVTIDAPSTSVWPWLVQMGQDRGGLYSYDWIENLVGLDFHNADRIVPEWQTLEVGDQIRAAPETAGAEAGFTVVAIDPGRSIVTLVGDPDQVVPEASQPPLPAGGTWVFVVEPLGDNQSRLLIRLRMQLDWPRPAAWIAERLLEPVHFVMERKQLLGIKERAERWSHSTANEGQSAIKEGN